MTKLTPLTEELFDALAEDAPNAPLYKTQTCRRCQGTGQHSNYGGDTRCFGCDGTGVVQIESGRRSLTDAELENWVDFLHGQAFAEDRARARKARKATR